MSSTEPTTRTEPPEQPAFRTVLGLDSRLLREHPALIFTIGYVAVSMIGMMFSWTLFRRFNIDIFDYAEITDFLMAALREPMTFLVAGGGFAVSWGVWLWARQEQRWFARRPPRSVIARAYYRMSRWSAHSTLAIAAIIPLYAYLFISFYADSRADAIRKGEGEVVRVFQEADAPWNERTLLGTSGKFVFLFDPAEDTVEILPIESLTAIEVPAPERDEDIAAPPSEPAEFPGAVEQ